MNQRPKILAIVTVLALATASVADARLPRGAVLSADEQSGDVTTGATVARGHAEITVPAHAIRGSAETIEIDPSRNEIRFTGAALVLVGAQRFESGSVVCSLDFQTCAAKDVDAAGAQPQAADAAAMTPR